MTLLDILSQQLVGKRIVLGPTGMIGATILSIGLHPYEPVFEIEIKHSDGIVEFVDFLGEWDLVME